MAATTTLLINDLEVQFSLSGLNDVLVSVGAVLSGNDSGITDQIGRKWSIAAPDPSSFTTFADLTESNVINFVKATDSYSTAVQQLTAQIDEKKQIGTKPLPWA